MLRVKSDVDGANAKINELVLGRVDSDLIMPSIEPEQVTISWDDGATRIIKVAPSLGSISEVNVVRRPSAAFTVSNSKVKENSLITLNPTNIVGDSTSANPLMIRWSLDGRNAWTTWTPPKKIDYRWAKSGVYEVVMEVKDAFGITNQVKSRIRVQGALQVNDFAIYDYGNQDKIINPGEKIRLDLRVQNSGTSDVKDLKVQLLSPVTAKMAAITDVINSGSAQMAGIQKGDMIVKLNSQPIGSDLSALINQQTPGAKIPVELLRQSSTIVNERITWERKILTVVVGKDDEDKPKLGLSYSMGLVDGATVLSQPAGYGDLDAGYFIAGARDRYKSADETKLYPENYGRFELQVSPLVAVGSKIPVTVVFTDNQGNTWQDGIELQIQKTAAQMKVNKFAIYDYGNQDKIINPGEKIRLDLRVQNAGTSDVKDLKVQLLTPVTAKMAVITDVINSGSAQMAGIQKGDMIVKLNSQPIGSDLSALINQQTPGAKIPVELLRQSSTIVNERITWERKILTVVVGKDDEDKPKLGLSYSMGLVDGATVLSQPAGYGDLDAGYFIAGARDRYKSADETKLYPENYGRFELQVTPKAVRGSKLPLKVEFRDSQGNVWEDQIELEIQ